MSIQAIITSLGSVVAALTPSPATPAFTQTDYRRDLVDEAKGAIERKFFVGFDGMEHNPGGEFGQLKARNDIRVYIDIGYRKNHREGGGGTSGLHGRAGTDIEQIMSEIQDKANYHSSMVGPWRELRVQEVDDNEQSVVFRITGTIAYDINM